MPEDKEFPAGMFVSRPRPGAREFIQGRISIRVDEFIEYLNEKVAGGYPTEPWLRIDIKESFKTDDDGNPKWYAQVDNWVKPSERTEKKKEGNDGLPF